MRSQRFCPGALWAVGAQTAAVTAAAAAQNSPSRKIDLMNNSQKGGGGPKVSTLILKTVGQQVYLLVLCLEVNPFL